MAKSRRGRPPSAEERALWDRVAKTTTPLDRQDRKVAAPPDFLNEPRQPVTRPETRIPEDFSIGARAEPSSGKQTASGTPPASLDRKAQTRLKRGRTAPEARIDLHGMTVAEAHPALIQFILSARAEGKRLVLVITGKGKDRDDGNPIPVRKGVLRQQVPGWLRSGPLAGAVLDIATAHQRYGGSGAYYVTLRRLR